MNVAEDAVSPSEILRHRVAEYRNRRQWSQQELADRAREYGLPWDRTTVAKIETDSKPRQVTIDELTALAYIFGVPVVSLLTPPVEYEEVRVAPKLSLPDLWFWLWATGVMPLGGYRFDEQGPSDDVLEREGEERVSFYFGAQPVAYNNADRRLPGLADIRYWTSLVTSAVSDERYAKAAEYLDDIADDVKDLKRRLARLQREEAKP